MEAQPITIEVRQNYGCPAFYVISEHKEAICKLTKTATVTVNHICALEDLGLPLAFVVSVAGQLVSVPNPIRR